MNLIKKMISFFLLSIFIFSTFSTSSAEQIPQRYAISNVVDQITPSVVSIQVLKKDGNNFHNTFFGSGFIINENGIILTNEHVIANADKVYIELFDGTILKNIEVVGFDKSSDIAVLKIAENELNYLLPTVKTGEPTKIRVGEFVVAFGSPYANHLGSELTVTSGIISTKSRIIETQKTVYQEYIQTDAPINPGNSGGPLVNLSGEVIGINSAMLSQAQGIGFAIPIDYALNISQEILEKGEISRPWLGITVSKIPMQITNKYGLKNEKGAYIKYVHPESPAAKARLKKGDVILEINNIKITDPENLLTMIKEKEVGENISLVINYNGTERQTVVKLNQKN
ncbi:MAG: S1C family serine protease [Bacillota bacterium]